MKTLTGFGDVQAAGAQVLREALAGRPELHAAGVRVGTQVPGDRSPESPHLPYVLVRLDSNVPHPSMANARCTLRGTVWHAGPDQAWDLAVLCHGLWLVHSGDVIRGMRPGTGPLPARDPETGIDLCTFTVLANVRPVLL